LRRIYSHDSRYCVVLISEHYDSGGWTQLEREAIQARELQGERGVLIPIKLGQYSPEWLSSGRIHFDLSLRPVSHLIRLLKARLKLDKEATSQPASSDLIRLLKARQELDKQATSQPASPFTAKSLHVAGVWRSVEVISHIHRREGIICLRQHADELSGEAELTETFSDLKKKLAFDLHGAINAATGTIRFTCALADIDQHDLGQYSVDRFIGHVVPDGTRIEGICTDERGISSRFTLTSC